MDDLQLRFLFDLTFFAFCHVVTRLVLDAEFLGASPDAARAKACVAAVLGNRLVARLALDQLLVGGEGVFLTQARDSSFRRLLDDDLGGASGSGQQQERYE